MPGDREPAKPLSEAKTLDINVVRQFEALVQGTEDRFKTDRELRKIAEACNVDHPEVEAIRKKARNMDEPAWLLARIARLADHMAETPDFDPEVKQKIMDQLVTPAINLLKSKE